MSFKLTVHSDWLNYFDFVWFLLFTQVFLVFVWNFELYMIPVILLVIYIRNLFALSLDQNAFKDKSQYVSKQVEWDVRQISFSLECGKYRYSVVIRYIYENMLEEYVNDFSVLQKSREVYRRYQNIWIFDVLLSQFAEHVGQSSLLLPSLPFNECRVNILIDFCICFAWLGFDPPSISQLYVMVVTDDKNFLILELSKNWGWRRRGKRT